MATKGTFPDGDATPLVELVGKHILKGGLVSTFFGRIVGVHVWSAGAKKEDVPRVRIGRPTLTHRNVSAALVVPGVDAAAAQSQLAAAGVTGAQLGASFGNTSAEFPADVSAEAVVDWTIAALKAVGASPADGWQYKGEKPDPGPS